MLRRPEYRLLGAHFLVRTFKLVRCWAGSVEPKVLGVDATSGVDFNRIGASITIDDLFNHAEVYYDYPLWTFTRGGKCPPIGHPEIDSMMPAVFTDSDAAQRVLDELKWHDAAPLEIPDPAFMLKMLGHFKGAGLKYVAFDVWLQTNTGQIVPIDLFMEGVRLGMKP